MHGLADVYIVHDEMKGGTSMCAVYWTQLARVLQRLPAAVSDVFVRKSKRDLLRGFPSPV